MKKLTLLLIPIALWAQNPTNRGALLANNINATVAASTTSYLGFGNPTLNASETQRQIPVPFSCNAGNLYVQTGGAQPASGALVVTVRKNGAATGLSVAVALSAVAGVYSDSSHTASFAPGDLLSVQFANAATAASAAVVGVSLSCQ